MFFKSLFKNINKKRTHLYRFNSSRNTIKLKERGMYQDIFPEKSIREIIDILNASPQSVYAGFDPTAKSLHIGNLLVLVNLIHWQRGGHNVIALIGGATAKIGDPSGRSTERDALKQSFIEDNIKGVSNNIQQVFANHEKYFWGDKSRTLLPVRILNNEDWYNKLSAVQLIGGAGRNLRMGTLLSRTSVVTRLSSTAGMSFTEFSYQLFQAYDWLHLCQKYGCTFQIGGNDQMGNIMSGHDLISKVLKQPVYGLTVPLITTEMGDKLGKSAGNAIWLSPDKTSPFTFYQFWVRTTDTEVERLLKLFTFDGIGVISEVMRKHKLSPEHRLAQKQLADLVTLLVHGEYGLKLAKTTSSALFEGSVAALGSMTAEEVAAVFQGATIVEVLPHPGQDVLDLAMKAGCFSNSGDALRIISAGGFYINQERVNNPSEVLNPTVHRLANNVTLLRVGKKNFYVIKWIA